MPALHKQGKAGVAKRLSPGSTQRFPALPHVFIFFRNVKQNVCQVFPEITHHLSPAKKHREYCPGRAFRVPGMQKLFPGFPRSPHFVASLGHFSLFRRTPRRCVSLLVSSTSVGRHVGDRSGENRKKRSEWKLKRVRDGSLLAVVASGSGCCRSFLNFGEQAHLLVE